MSRPVVVGKTSMVTVARACHSVSVTYVGRMLRGECFVERIEIFDGPTRVAVHQPSYERGATEGTGQGRARDHG